VCSPDDDVPVPNICSSASDCFSNASNGEDMCDMAANGTCVQPSTLVDATHNMKVVLSTKQLFFGKAAKYAHGV
jgi:hypothetical protein